MADIHLPPTLTPLFPGLPRRVDVDAETVDEALDRLDEQCPASATVCASRGRLIRSHIHVYVDRERAALDTPVDDRSRVDVIAAISGG